MAAHQTSELEHQDSASKVAENLQSMGHAFGTQDVIPTTADTPIQKSPEMHSLGVEVVGEDLSHILETSVGDLTTGSHKYRITKSGRFLNMLREKLLGRKEK